MNTYETWPYYSDFKLYTSDSDLISQLRTWTSVKRSCSYSDSRGKVYAYDFIFPAKLRKRLAKLNKGKIPSTTDGLNRPVEAQTAP